MSGNPDYRFPKSARLLTSREFQRVASQGRRHVSRCFTLLAHQGDSPGARLGITVSRKVGKSVTRSRIKRVVREFFRLHRAGLTPGIECVVIAKPAAGQTANADLTHNLQELFLRYHADRQ
ncbi:MAG: ribonuclease P protein component [Magnetococcales bacterium]|nr:ribonuclease P protein component [Magnetococcales bacterium]